MKNVFFGLGIGILFLLTGCLGGEEPFDHLEQFEKEQKIIDQYIADNNLNTMTDTSGFELRYAIITEGTGESPKAKNVLHTNVKESLLTSGKVITEEDSIYVRLDEYIIGGLQVLLPYMKEGGEMLMLIPSFYAYGNQGSASGSVPPNSPMIYRVTLHEIFTQFEFEQQKIDEYILKNDLLDQVDTTETEGIRYIIEQEGTGQHPKSTDKVNVTYKGTFLANGEVFDSNSNVTLNLNALIQGWRLVLPLIKEGGKITMFLPSKYAYGESGSSSIPGNATLIFEVTLHEVVD